MKDDFRLDGLTILVTGATSGIGRATAVMAHDRGAHVVATGRRDDALRDLAAQLERRISTIRADLTESTDVEKLVNETKPLDGAVFAAGQLKIKLAKATKPAELQAMMSANVESSALLAGRLLGAKKIQNGGSLVFISSVAASIGSVGHGSYAASKGALDAFVRTLAVEIASTKTRANLVAPAEVRTPMLDTARAGELGKADDVSNYILGVGEPTDVASACCFLLAPASRWITGTTLTVDGGFSAVRT